MTNAAHQPGRIEVRDAVIELGSKKERFRAVDRVSFNIEAGQFICLLGPSGCGKSTLLGALAGHIPLADGSLSLDGKAIVGPSSERGLVFQQHTLFPWKRIVDNVAFGLKMGRIGKTEKIGR